MLRSNLSDLFVYTFYRKILNEISTLDNMKDVNEKFQQEILATNDPFNVIAKYCSQGLFNPLTVVNEPGVIHNNRPRSSNAERKYEKNPFL